MDWLVSRLLELPLWTTLTLVFLLPALEASSFPGIVLPGQSAIVAGGIFAQHGRASVVVVVVAAVLGAVVGSGVGYAVGRKWGDALLKRLPRRLAAPSEVARMQDWLRRLGGWAVFLSRFVGVARTLVPGLSGMAALSYRQFLFWNVISGMVWGTGCVLVGFLAGRNWDRMASWWNVGNWVLIGVAALLVGRALYRRMRRRRLGVA